MNEDEEGAWENTPYGRRSSIPLEDKERIANAAWKATKKEATFSSKDPNEIASLAASLETADIKFQHIPRTLPSNVQRLIVKVSDLDAWVPEWRDAMEARKHATAVLRLKEDAEKSEKEGRPWVEGGANPNHAIMICVDENDANTLIKMLDAANITITRREGKDGTVIVVPTHLLRKAGIDVKRENDVPLESEDQQKADAREWLKNRVKWDVPKEESPLARAVFKNRGAAEVAVENLLILQCTKDLRRLPDQNGLTLEVNADALKAAVKDVAIAPFSRIKGGGEKGEDERCAGR